MIGEATARKLEESHIHVDVIPEQLTSQAIFAALENYTGGSTNLRGLNFLIPRAAIARDSLPDLLANAGARVDVVAAYRTVRVHSVGGADEVVRALAPEAHWIEAIGLEIKGSERARLAALFSGTGAPRITAVGSLQRPELAGTHGGVHRLLPFIRWCTVELGVGRGRPKRGPARAAKRKRPPGRARRPSAKGKKRS